MSNKIEIYGDSISGNCYKLQLICAQLEIDHVWHEMDLLKGEARTKEFRAMNPNGKTPLLKLADGRYLPESNAILYYLSQGTLPRRLSRQPARGKGESRKQAAGRLQGT